MELNYANNLFLGKEELEHFKLSLGIKGFRRMFQQIASSYGVVKLDSDVNFDALKVVDGTVNGQLTIQDGNAVDSDIEVIEVESDLVDHLTIPGDNITYYIIAEYAQTATQQGTVSITATGQVTGVGTNFTEVLRALPNFPSVITFNGSVNTQEYVIADIVNDTNLQLNVASGILTAEAGKTYDVVGTFTPGVAVPGSSKYPMQRDGYSITSSASASVTAGKQFLLASVVNDGVTTTIKDLRNLNIFSLSNANSDDLISGHPFATLINASYDETSSIYNAEGDGSENYYEFEWGFFSSSGNWTFSGGTNLLTISTGAGGSWGATSDFVDNSFDGWYVYFTGTGQKVKIINSVLNEPIPTVFTIQLILEGTVPLTGDIVVVPPGDLIEITGRSIFTFAGKEVASKTFSIASGSGIIRYPAGDAIYARYRWISSNKTSNLEEFNDNTYINEEGASENLTTSTIATFFRDNARAEWGAEWAEVTDIGINVIGVGVTSGTATMRYRKNGKTVHGTVSGGFLDTEINSGVTTNFNLFNLPFTFPTTAVQDQGTGRVSETSIFDVKSTIVVPSGAGNINVRKYDSSAMSAIPAFGLLFSISFTFEID